MIGLGSRKISKFQVLETENAREFEINLLILNSKIVFSTLRKFSRKFVLILENVEIPENIENLNFNTIPENFGHYWKIRKFRERVLIPKNFRIVSNVRDSKF